MPRAVERENFAWGLFFILIGVILTLFSYGVIPLSIFNDWWKLLPLVIFGIIGLALVFGKSDSKIEVN